VSVNVFVVLEGERSEGGEIRGSAHRMQANAERAAEREMGIGWKRLSDDDLKRHDPRVVARWERACDWIEVVAVRVEP
jgi:hypothetical protein